MIEDKCYRLTGENGNEVQAYPHEPLFLSQEEEDIRIVLHCLEINKTSAASSTIIVRSLVIDVLIMLTRYVKDIQMTVLFETGIGNIRRLLNVNHILQTKGEIICLV